MSLATKYRPNKFEDVCSQNSIIQILKRQVETKHFSKNYLFCGASGIGKTTLARIFANELNDHKGTPIEIDGASNNGVDNVRAIVDSAKERSLDSKYKVFIIDEAHMITIQGWNAFLKCIEEIPEYTIFIFCTTNPEKIPATIQNRVMRFNLTKIPTIDIKNRLTYIAQQENISITPESIDYIAKISNGGMREAISLLEKCYYYNSSIDINNTIACLGDFSYNTYFKLTDAFADWDEKTVLSIIEDFYNSGKDLSQFIDQYLKFTIDLNKYCLFKDLSYTNIPSFLEEKAKYTTGMEDSLKYFNYLTSKILNIKNSIKNDSNILTTVEALCLSICRGQ